MNIVKWSLGQNELQWGLSCYLLQLHGNLHLSKQFFSIKKKADCIPRHCLCIPTLFTEGKWDTLENNTLCAFGFYQVFTSWESKYIQMNFLLWLWTMNKLSNYLLKVFLSEAHTLVVESRCLAVSTAWVRIWMSPRCSVWATTEAQLRGAAPGPRAGAAAKRSCPRSKGRGGGQEELPQVQGKEPWLHFAEAAMKRHPRPR